MTTLFHWMKSKKQVDKTCKRALEQNQYTSSRSATTWAKLKVRLLAKEWKMRQLQYLKDLPVNDELRKAIQLTLKVYSQPCCLRRSEQSSIKEGLILRYHYGGKGVLSIGTPKGQAVITAIERDSSEDFSEALKCLTADERKRAVFSIPEPWDEDEFHPTSQIDEADMLSDES